MAKQHCSILIIAMSWRRAHGEGSNLLQRSVIVSMLQPIKNILDPSPAVDCRLLQHICRKPDLFGPFSREFFLASARCRQLDMKATDPNLHVCKATAPCTESVFHLSRVARPKQCARKKGEKRCDGTELLGHRLCPADFIIKT